MSGRVTKWIVGSRTVVLAGALVFGAGGLVGGGVAGASSAHAHSPAHGARGGKRMGHGRALPRIGHPKDLSAEPVVHADKKKPSKKLLVKDLVVGTGAKASGGSTVEVKYVGADYANGKDFTSATWQEDQAASFSLAGGVIPGFAKGIAGMRVGGRREIVIPPSLGYRARGTGPIKGGETIVFVVDLLGVSS